MTKTHLGLRFYVSAGVPATIDAAGFAALTWTEVTGAQQLPRTAFDTSTIAVSDMQRAFTQTLGGVDQGAASSMVFRAVAGDTGQALIKTQARTVEKFLSYKKLRGTGTGMPPAPVTGDAVEYGHGIVTAYQPNEATESNHEGFTATFTPNTLEVIATQPAP